MNPVLVLPRTLNSARRNHLAELARDCATVAENFTRQSLSEVRLFVGVLTLGSNFQARQAIRETWGSDSRLHR